MLRCIKVFAEEQLPKGGCRSAFMVRRNTSLRKRSKCDSCFEFLTNAYRSCLRARSDAIPTVFAS